MPAAAYVAATILLTVFGQLVVKWRVNVLSDDGGDTQGRLQLIGSLFTDPYVLIALAAAGLAAACWMLALSRLDLSVAYPFAALSFVLVLIGSAIFFQEPLTFAKVAGVVLILVGIVVGSR